MKNYQLDDVRSERTRQANIFKNQTASIIIGVNKAVKNKSIGVNSSGVFQIQDILICHVACLGPDKYTAVLIKLECSGKITLFYYYLDKPLHNALGLLRGVNNLPPLSAKTQHITADKFEETLPSIIDYLLKKEIAL